MIRAECLAWALKNGERYGVWGGLTEQQRRRLARQVA
jgi:WhiB family redox-sensing transcriptional regulator